VLILGQLQLIWSLSTWTKQQPTLVNRIQKCLFAAKLLRRSWMSSQLFVRQTTTAPQQSTDLFCWLFLITEDRRPVMTTRRISTLFYPQPTWCTPESINQSIHIVGPSGHSVFIACLEICYHWCDHVVIVGYQKRGFQISALPTWLEYFNLRRWTAVGKRWLGDSSPRIFVVCPMFWPADDHSTICRHFKCRKSLLVCCFKSPGLDTVGCNCPHHSYDFLVTWRLNALSFHGQFGDVRTDLGTINSAA